MQLTFTPLESEILLHRLEIPDAIADCLLDTDTPRWTHDEIWDACRSMENDLRGKKRTLTLDDGDDLKRAALIDAIEGSTYLGVTSDAYNNREITAQKVAAVESAFMGLAARIEVALDVKLTLPV